MYTFFIFLFLNDKIPIWKIGFRQKKKKANDAAEVNGSETTSTFTEIIQKQYKFIQNQQNNAKFKNNKYIQINKQENQSANDENIKQTPSKTAQLAKSNDIIINIRSSNRRRSTISISKQEN